MHTSVISQSSHNPTWIPPSGWLELRRMVQILYRVTLLIIIVMECLIRPHHGCYLSHISPASSLHFAMITQTIILWGPSLPVGVSGTFSVIPHTGPYGLLYPYFHHPSPACSLGSYLLQLPLLHLTGSSKNSLQLSSWIVSNPLLKSVLCLLLTLRRFAQQ